MKRIAAPVALAIIVFFVWMLVPKLSANGGIALAVGLSAVVTVVFGLMLAGHSALVLFYVGRLALILAAYLGAVLTASAFIWFAFMAGGVSDIPPRELPAFLAGMLLFSVFPIGFIIPVVALCTFLPAAATILIAEVFGMRSLVFYVLGGAATGFIATELFARWVQSASAAAPALGFRATMIGGGMVGSLVYWLIAGRFAGRWWARSWAQIERVPG